MSRKEYNGLRSHQVPIGSGMQVPQLGAGMSREQQAQRAIAMEMQAICRELFVRAASSIVLQGDMTDHPLGPETLANLAARCQIAARDYFIGLGVITEEPAAE
jgi:hypothetical protein